jgi:ferrochelatase
MSAEAERSYDTVLLLGFGGPESPEEIRPFLARVLAGRPVPPERFRAVVENYARIGGSSPYNALTRRLAAALEAALRERGSDVPVRIAYRNTEPFLDDVMRELKGRRVLAIPLATHEGEHARDRYVRDCTDAARRAGNGGPAVDYTDPFFDEPRFVRAQADRVRAACARLGAGAADAEVIFTAHSVPSEGSGRYASQFRRTAALIAEAAAAPRWSCAYQSRSGSPRDPWLGPDVRDVLRELPEHGIRHAVVAPIGFLCDHVEVLFDLDVDAFEVARRAGVRMERAQTIGDHPDFVRMLAERV